METKSLGSIIKERRKQLQIPVPELAQAIGKTRGTIYRYEASDIKAIPKSIIEKLAAKLDLPPQELMGWPGENNEPASSYIDVLEKIRNDVIRIPTRTLPKEDSELFILSLDTTIGIAKRVLAGINVDNMDGYETRHKASQVEPTPTLMYGEDVCLSRIQEIISDYYPTVTLKPIRTVPYLILAANGDKKKTLCRLYFSGKSQRLTIHEGNEWVMHDAGTLEDLQSLKDKFMRRMAVIMMK